MQLEDPLANGELGMLGFAAQRLEKESRPLMRSSLRPRAPREARRSHPWKDQALLTPRSAGADRAVSTGGRRPPPRDPGARRDRARIDGPDPVRGRPCARPEPPDPAALNRSAYRISPSTRARRSGSRSSTRSTDHSAAMESPNRLLRLQAGGLAETGSITTIRGTFSFACMRFQIKIRAASSVVGVNWR